MNRDSNRGIDKVYSLLSTFENTFVLFYDDERDHLWISRPIPRGQLLFAMYFVLIIQLHQQGYSEIFPDGLSTLVKELLNKYPGKSEGLMKISNRTLNISQSSVNEIQRYSLADLLYASWKKGPREMIATGRTCYVFKVSIKPMPLAFKMVNLFRNVEDSLEELDNEYQVMQRINDEYSK